MFEVFGRTEKRFDIEKLKRLHKTSGVIYLLTFSIISYLCLRFIFLSGSELTARGTFHAIFALTILVLFGLKVIFIHIYKQYYESVKTIGIIITLVTFGMLGTSSGYYLLVSKFGTDRAFDSMMQYKMKARTEMPNDQKRRMMIKTDAESIAKGKRLYESECVFCHYPDSTAWYFGPGHKGILKKPVLPVSKKPATPENIVNQLKNPYKDMPSYSYLSDEEILNLIAYLNTL